MPSQTVRMLLRGAAGTRPGAPEMPPAAGTEMAAVTAAESGEPAATAGPEDERRARAGYVEHPGGPRCGNCAHVDGERCGRWGFAVDPANGCCDDWEAGGSTGPGPSTKEGQREQTVAGAAEAGGARPAGGPAGRV